MWRTPPSCKIEQRPCVRNGLTDRHKIWLGDAYWPFEPDGQLIFELFKIQDGRRLPFWKIGKRSYLRSQNSQLLKIRDGEWPPFETENR